LQVKGTGTQTARTHIRAYHQFNYNDLTGTDTVEDGAGSHFATFGGVATSTGSWYLALDAFQGAIGDYASKISSTIGAGSGFIWQEFDNTSASGNATVSAGAITSISVAQGGSGYTSPPTVYILPVAGTAGAGATATATVAGGAVTGFTVTNGGAGYSGTTSHPIVACYGGKLTTDGFATGGAWADIISTDPAGVNAFRSYPTFRRIRWMAEIGGDTSGTLVPTFVALLFEFNEYSKVEYQYAIRIRMRVGDTHIKNGTKADGSDKSLYDTPAAIVAARDALEALKNQHLIVPYTGLDAHTWNVLVTKVTHDTISVDSTGIQESETELTLQIQQLLGTV
jgi:hypothetical protein